jgi:intracellular sulfur oxidation DsrE/DsrF family protein
MTVKFIGMLGILVVAGASVLAVAGAAPAAQKHRVVFQVVSEGDEQWDAVLGNVENLRTAFGAANTEVAVIAHGKGLGMLIAADNKHAERMRKLADSGVAFVACENTMRKKNVAKGQLLPFATTVDSGVAEVVRKQEQGWAYIKSGT